MSTWNSQSSASSWSSILDENDPSNILVYKYRIGNPKLEILSKSNLCKFLKGDSKYRVSKKQIPRGDSRVDVRMEDIFTEDERSTYSDKPNFRSSLASVGLPREIYWKRLFFNSYPDLYIVSTLSSPESSVNSSPENSQHVSPSNTFPPNGQAEGRRDVQPHSENS